MSLLPLPAPSASAGLWGKVAVSIPGWRWPVSIIPHPGPGKGTEVHVMLPALYDPEGKEFMPVTWGAGWLRHWSPVPDVDHWAWEGWLLRLLSRKLHIECGQHLIRIVNLRDAPKGGLYTEGQERNFGRTCVAAAHALGRWPGGEG